MLKLTAKTNTSPIALFAAYLDNFNEIVAGEGMAVYEDYKPVILQRLRQDPGPVKRPIQWTSEKQRRAFFSTDGFGGGIPTKRTGAIVNAYDVLNVTEGGVFKIIIVASPKSKWLKGALGLRSKQYQQPMHKNTGYELAAPVANLYLEAMQTEFLDRIKTRVSDFGSVTGSSRRAYTGR
jgi:hypothetical protein